MKVVEDQFGDWASILGKICAGKNISLCFDLGFLFLIEIDYHLHQGFANPYFIQTNYCYLTAGGLLINQIVQALQRIFYRCTIKVVLTNRSEWLQQRK